MTWLLVALGVAVWLSALTLFVWLKGRQPKWTYPSPSMNGSLEGTGRQS